MNHAISVPRKVLRQQIKEKLQNLAPNDCLASSQKITNKITENQIFISSKKIACYMPIDNEIDIWPIIRIIWQQKKICYLPSVNQKIKYNLQFIEFQEHDQLITSEYNIQEPKFSIEKVIAPQNLDLVIVPLLGFNCDNFRLGRGAGCYDRTFAFKLQQLKTKPYLLGIGYNWQQIEFEQKPWDIAMNEIIHS